MEVNFKPVNTHTHTKQLHWKLQGCSEEKTLNQNKAEYTKS